MREYWVKVGDGPQPSVRLGTWLELKVFLFGMFMGGGQGTDRADALAEEIADHLVRGDEYPHKEAGRLRDGRRVYAWGEGTE